MKKALGLVFILALAFVCFLMLKQCQSSGGGQSPLAFNKAHFGVFLCA